MTTVDVDEVRHIVKRILATYPIEESWPSNIIDRVFKGIEDLDVDKRLYKHLIGKNEEYKSIVNPLIGKLVKEMTGLETIQESVPATLSNLIESYTELG